jgi:predicted DNA-binding protein (MmcQ/YjbR family)
MASSGRGSSKGGPSRGSRRTAGGHAPTRAGGTAALRDFCRSLPHATEDVKWEDNLIFSVGGKIFAGFDLEDSPFVAFKCDDDDFDTLVERGEADGSVVPAPYSARFGWVRARRGGVLSDSDLRALLTKAHNLIAAKLPKKTRREMGLDPA